MEDTLEAGGKSFETSEKRAEPRYAVALRSAYVTAKVAEELRALRRLVEEKYGVETGEVRVFLKKEGYLKTSSRDKEGVKEKLWNVIDVKRKTYGRSKEALIPNTELEKLFYEGSSDEEVGRYHWLGLTKKEESHESKKP